MKTLSTNTGLVRQNHGQYKRNADFEFRAYLSKYMDLVNCSVVSSNQKKNKYVIFQILTIF